jgi:UDP-N-acetylmuramoylalanine--D-glutamate ligase
MDLAGKRVTVMGLGRFGGGVGVARYLVKQGADVLVTDTLPADQIKDSLDKLKGLPIDYRLGEHNVSDFTTPDLVVANPAVKPDNRFLRAAEAAGIPITSEIRLLVQALPNRKRTIGVTGTAGKSTTTAMIGHILRKAYPQPPALPGDQSTKTAPRVWVGGNIGGSLLDHIDEIGKDDWVVLELSSFMLHGLRENKYYPGWSPHIAVVTNIGQNHLDWHGTFNAYVQDKEVILDYQKIDQDAVILGPGLAELIRPNTHNICIREEQNIRGNSPIDLRLPGFHNQINATLAIDTVQVIGINRNQAIASLADFPGLPHRLQFVLEHNGVRYYNDSKCTTPEAAELAIRSFDPGAAHIILGGYDKGSDLKPLAGFASENCAGIYTIGVTGEGIATAAEAASHACEVVRCETLDAAVREVVKRAKPGQVVLLSPACASWDQFDNYERRGERFIELVKQAIG